MLRSGMPSAIALLLVAGAPALSSSQTLTEVITGVHKARLAVPAYRASVIEVVKAGGSAPPLTSRDQSWGLRDGQREFSVSHSGERLLFETRDEYGANDRSKNSSRTSLLSNGVRQTIYGRYRQGDIDARESPDPYPAEMNYWLNGKPIDRYIGALESSSVSRSDGGTMLVKGQDHGLDVSLTLDAKNFTMLHAQLGSVMTIDVSGYEDFGGTPIPRLVSENIRPQSAPFGISAITKTYTVTSVVPLPATTHLGIAWPKGTQVVDLVNDRQLVANEKGVLVGNTMFDKEARANFAKRSTAFLIAGFVGVLSLCMLIVRAVKGRRERNALGQVE